MRPSELMGLFREERGVNAAEYDQRACVAGQLPELIAAQRVARMDADAHHIARADGRRIQLIERFVGDNRIAES